MSIPRSVYKADCRDLFWIPDGAVQCVVTSTAYFAKRRYGDSPDEMGQGSMDEFIKEQVALGQEMWRVLAKRGIFFLNIGDTNSGSGGAGGDHNPAKPTDGKKPPRPKGSKLGIPKYRGSGTRTGLKAGQSSLIPERIAIALQADGWLVRSKIVWDKGQIKPEDPNHVHRPRTAYETILMLTKQVQVDYYHEREVEPGDVWHFPPYRGTRLGPAVFPLELPRRCILVGSKPGDLVLDPCAGSDQTGRAALALDRRYIGADLYGHKRPPKTWGI